MKEPQQNRCHEDAGGDANQRAALFLNVLPALVLELAFLPCDLAGFRWPGLEGVLKSPRLGTVDERCNLGGCHPIIVCIHSIDSTLTNCICRRARCIHIGVTTAHAFWGVPSVTF